MLEKCALFFILIMFRDNYENVKVFIAKVFIANAKVVKLFIV